MTLKETIKNLPKQPGIYQYFDKNGRLLYIGKAKNLANRVKSYWLFTPHLHPNPKLSPRIVSMLEQTSHLQYIVVQTEHDALILENSLIKQLNPKYNILLRDDKTYPYIYFDNTQQYGRFDITRKLFDTKDITYFGPYSVGARDILDSVYELTKLVQKKGSLKAKKLCLYFQLNKCLGPCELPITDQQYQKEVAYAKKLIQNKSLLIQKLQEKMELYAENLRFEEAAQIRDRIDKIGRSEIKSDIDFATHEHYDIFAVTTHKNLCVIVKLFMRHGKIISSAHDIITFDGTIDLNEVYSQAIINFYNNAKPPIIAPILVAHTFEDHKLIESYLSHLFEKKASIHIPQKGKKKQLIELALLNGTTLLQKEKSSQFNTIIQDIQQLCHLEAVPRRIEVFDNSHMGGVAPVGSMIVYDNGKFDKSSYRNYHLHAHDEYHQMKETLSRRIEKFSTMPPPDLWVLDGGATLLELAYDLLKSYGTHLDVIAIAKEKIDTKAHRAKGKANDILYTKEHPIKLPSNDPRLHFIQRLRDEAHRSAISFHKKTKLKLDQESNLLQLQGVSHAKIKKLLDYYGTFEAIKKGTFDEISTILNKKDAKIIKNFYK